jgi:hypothetical protein
MAELHFPERTLPAALMSARWSFCCFGPALQKYAPGTAILPVPSAAGHAGSSGRFGGDLPWN